MYPYAERLARLLLLPATTPLTIGVEAAWGVGKSTFMGFVERALIKLTPANADEPRIGERRLAFRTAMRRLASPGRSPVRSEPEELEPRATELADLDETIRTITLGLETVSDSTAEADSELSCALGNMSGSGCGGRWSKTPRRTSSVSTSTPGATRTRHRSGLGWRVTSSGGWRPPCRAAAAGPCRSPMPGSTGAPSSSSSSCCRRSRRSQFSPSWRWAPSRPSPSPSPEGKEMPRDPISVVGAALGGAAALAVGAWAVFAGARRVLIPVSARVLDYVRRPAYAERMGYQHLVLDDLRFVLDRLRAGRDRPRVVVFIDDLDRCADEKVMEILQAINLILGESDFFVVLGMDTDMIQNAIGRQYPGADSELPARYLRKIVQLRFSVPEIPAGARGEYAAGLLGPAPAAQDPAVIRDGARRGGARLGCTSVELQSQCPAETETDLGRRGRRHGRRARRLPRDRSVPGRQSARAQSPSPAATKTWTTASPSSPRGSTIAASAPPSSSSPTARRRFPGSPNPCRSRSPRTILPPAGCSHGECGCTGSSRLRAAEMRNASVHYGVALRAARAVARIRAQTGCSRSPSDGSPRLPSQHPF